MDPKLFVIRSKLERAGLREVGGTPEALGAVLPIPLSLSEWLAKYPGPPEIIDDEPRAQSPAMENPPPPNESPDPLGDPKTKLRRPAPDELERG